MEIPTGFDDAGVRKDLAGRLVRMIDAYEASIGERVERYRLAQDVYDDKEVMSSLEFIEDYDPYNVPLMQIRVDGVVSNVCGGYTLMDPYWVLKGGGDENDRDAAENDLTYAFERAQLDLKVRQMGYAAALQCRGPARLTYQTIHEGAFSDAQGVEGDGEVSYSGLVIDPIKPERFVLYPTYAPNASKATMVGHWFEMAADEVIERQIDGEWLDEWDPIGTDDSGETDANSLHTIVDEAGDAPVKIYDLIVKLRPPTPAPKETNDADEEFDEEGEPTKELRQKRRWYRVVLAYTSQEVLLVEEYNDPWPNYFAPTFKAEIDEFWSEHSIGTRLLELQAIVNDAVSLQIFGGATSAFLTVLASGFVTDAQTTRIGIGQLVGFKGNPNFTVLPSKFDPRTGQATQETAERYADGIARASQLGQGQPLEGNKTATEAGILAAGQAAGTAEHRVTFGDEIVRMAQYGLFLLGQNFREWRKHNKDSIQAESAKAYKRRYNLEINGKTSGNTPQVVIEKLKALIEAAKAMGLIIVPPTTEISADALFEAFLNALELHVATSKIVIEPEDQLGEAPPLEQSTDPLAALISHGEYGPPDPELLAQLAASAAQSQIPPGMGEIGGLLAAGGVPDLGLIDDVAPGLPDPGGDPLTGGPF